MTQTQDPDKRIPKSIGTDSQLLGRYTLSDLVVVGAPGVLVILGTQLLLPQSMRVLGVQPGTLAIPIAGLGIVAGFVVVTLAPAHTDSLDWVTRFVGFHRGTTKLGHDAAKSRSHVERIYPEHDAIERTDGTLVRAVQVTPPTMALATDEEWTRKTSAFEEFVNTVVEFPLQIFSTTRPFPAAEYTDRYESRLDDPDVQANPKLRALLEHYVDWYERDLAQRQMTIRDHYVLIPVRPESVHYERESPLQRLDRVPALRVILQAWTAPSQHEERAAMVAELDDRVRRVEHGLRAIDGCTTTPIDATALTRLLAEYWAGEELEDGIDDEMIRTTPLVTSTTHVSQ